MFLICHLISEDHVIKGSCVLLSCSPSQQFTILPGLVAIGTLVVVIQCS